MSTIRARIRGGTLEPVERVDLPEGTEVTVTIVRVLARQSPCSPVWADGLATRTQGAPAPPWACRSGATPSHALTCGLRASRRSPVAP